MHKKREPLSDVELASIVRAKLDAAGPAGTNTLSPQRAEYLATYFRYGYQQDAEAAAEDRSTTVDSTAADTVDWMMAQLVRTFVGGDRVVSFIPSGPDDVQDAETEMDVIEHVLRVQNNAYLVFFSWIWDGLVTDVGYVKAFREEKVVKEVEEYSGLTEDDLTAMVADLEEDGAKVEIVNQVEHQETVTVEALALQTDPEVAALAQDATDIRQTEDGQVEIIHTTYDVKIRIARAKRAIKVMAIPGDEVIVPAGWTSISLAEAPYCGHVCGLSTSDLISKGFDPEQIEKLPTFDASQLSEERQTRHGLEESGILGADDGLKMVTEAYVRIDRDGDGYDELLMVVMGGNEILRFSDGSVAVEEVEEIPIHSWSPYLIPHRHAGEGVVCRTADIQRNRTGTERAMMDNMAFTSNPRTIIGDDARGGDTISDALTYRPGGVIRARDATQVVPYKLPSVLGEVLPVLEYWDQRKEERTGVTRYNQGLDADSLNKTATGVSMIKEAGLDKVEMIARNLAETGYASLIQHIHALLRRHQDKEMEIEVAGKWIKADPRQWGERSNLRVAPGLGAGSRERKQLMLAAVIDRQVQIASTGAPLTDMGRIYNALRDWSSTLGIADPSRYFADPTDPEVIKAQQAAAQDAQGQTTPEQDLAAAQVEAARMGAVAKLEDVRAQREASARADQLKLLDMRVKDDRERDIALLRAIAELEKAGMTAQVQQLRGLLTPEALAGNAQQV
ncbi:MAG: hypothetical protein R3F54_28755 [Alphaproteobacteria bacterium]